MPWHPVNPYHFYLKWVSLDCDHARLMRGLRPLGEAIAECAERADRVALEHSDYADVFIDEETALIETLLGTVFVVCQTHITAIRSRLQALHRYHLSQELKNPLTTTTGRKQDILRFGGRKIRKAGYSAVEAIDGFANYFKHNDEWYGNWKKLKGQAAGTVAIITAVGAQQGSTGNLRTAAERLGNKKYSDVGAFAKPIKEWGTGLVRAYTRECRRRGLI